MSLTFAQYDALERAIVDGARITFFRRGTEYLVIPMRIITVAGSEAVVARHPTTGASLTIRLDETSGLELVK